MRERSQITDGDVEEALVGVRAMVDARLREKGCGSLVSRHEMLGVVVDEHNELVAAVSSKASRAEVEHELLDIAVACVVALASYKTGGVEW